MSDLSVGDKVRTTPKLGHMPGEVGKVVSTMATVERPILVEWQTGAMTLRVAFSRDEVELVEPWHGPESVSAWRA